MGPEETNVDEAWGVERSHWGPADVAGGIRCHTSLMKQEAFGSPYLTLCQKD